MNTYFYTVRLCEDCAYRLELLSRSLGFEDVETFAEVVIERGLSALEDDLRHRAAAAVERRARRFSGGSEFKSDLDDEIPF
jgi:hypothetical protein